MPHCRLLTRAEVIEGDDPVLGQFLGFLATDIARHPERLQTLDIGLAQRLQSLTANVDIDLDAALRLSRVREKERQ